MTSEEMNEWFKENNLDEHCDQNHCHACIFNGFNCPDMNLNDLDEIYSSAKEMANFLNTLFRGGTNNG